MTETAVVVKDAKKRQEQEYKSRIADYLKTFTSGHGRRVLKDMRASYCDQSRLFDEDPGQTAFNVGKREVVKDIEALLRTGKNPKLIEDLFRQPEDEGFEV